MIDLPVPITTAAEYALCIDRGYNPLLDYKRFKLSVPLRIAIQREIFGKSYISKGNLVQANQRFYHYCWYLKPNRCEECLAPLKEYSSKFISHIITRGARPDIAHDPRNVNILCYKHHSQWEDATARQDMRIFKTNQKIIATLKAEYQC